MTAPASVEAYLASRPEDARANLEKLRQVIKAAAPKATETISYQMPAFEHEGRLLVSYAAFKDHYSLFPMSGDVIAAIGDELKPYASGKGTIRFDPSKPLPVALVKKVVKVRLQELESRRHR